MVVCLTIRFFEEARNAQVLTKADLEWSSGAVIFFRQPLGTPSRSHRERNLYPFRGDTTWAREPHRAGKPTRHCGVDLVATRIWKSRNPTGCL